MKLLIGNILFPNWLKGPQSNMQTYSLKIHSPRLQTSNQLWRKMQRCRRSSCRAKFLSKIGLISLLFFFFIFYVGRKWHFSILFKKIQQIHPFDLKSNSVFRKSKTQKADFFIDNYLRSRLKMLSIRNQTLKLIFAK